MTGDLRSRVVFSVPKPPVISLSDRAEERVLFFPISPIRPIRIYGKEGRAPSALRMGTVAGATNHLMRGWALPASSPTS